MHRALGQGRSLVAQLEQADPLSRAARQDDAVEPGLDEDRRQESDQRPRPADRRLRRRHQPRRLGIGLDGEAERGRQQLAVAEVEPAGQADQRRLAGGGGLGQGGERRVELDSARLRLALAARRSQQSDRKRLKARRTGLERRVHGISLSA